MGEQGSNNIVRRLLAAHEIRHGCLYARRRTPECVRGRLCIWGCQLLGAGGLGHKRNTIHNCGVEFDLRRQGHQKKAQKFHIPVFDGDREIMSLPVFPARFQDVLDSGTRRKQLIERGKRFFASTKGPTFLEYTGLGQKLGWKKVSKHVSFGF
jgi:hypothetical protein